MAVFQIGGSGNNVRSGNNIVGQLVVATNSSGVAKTLSGDMATSEIRESRMVRPLTTRWNRKWNGLNGKHPNIWKVISNFVKQEAEARRMMLIAHGGSRLRHSWQHWPKEELRGLQGKSKVHCD